MKIMLVVPTFERGGAERVASALSQEWANYHAVTVATFDSTACGYAMGGTVVDLRILATTRLCKKLALLARRTKALYSELKRRDPDLVIAFMESASIPIIIASLMARRTDQLRVSVRVAAQAIPRGHQLFAMVLYRFASRTIGVSRGVTRDCRRVLRIPRRRCITIPNPLQLDRIAACSAAPRPHGRPYILAVGRLEHQKAYDVLIQAYCSISNLVPHDLIIVGDGSLRGVLQNLIRALGLADRATLVGERTDPWAYMHHCSVFALPSRNEGWPNALVEAMACGRPVVAADCEHGPREIIKHGRNGVLVRVNDEMRLARALLRFVQDPAFASSCGQNAAVDAQNYSVKSIAKQWLR